MTSRQSRGGSRGRTGGGRQARRASRLQASSVRAPYIQRKISTFDILSEEGLELIEHNADLILKDIGVEFRDDPEILELFRNAGADVSGELVRFEPGHCRSIIATSAPAQFKQHARNSENTIILGGSNTVLAPGWGPPFIHDLDEGRRYGTIEDFRKLIKICHMLPEYHHSGGVICEPVDLPANKRHLDMLASHFRYSDRAVFGALIGAERAQDSVNMAKIVFGEDFVANNACLYAVSNSNAPLVWDSAMTGALKVYARNNQAVAVTPWTLAGAMSPCTAAGTLAQVLAEAQAGLALAQLVSPGAPCLFGSFASTISMQSGAPTFGSPESAHLVLAAGQLARRLGVPFHTVGALTSSKVPDGQAMEEGTWGLMMSVMAGANFINHAGGWLEGGLVHGFEKAVMDADICGKVAAFAQGLDLSEKAQALDAIQEVGPGSHFLGSSHTHANFQTAFFYPQNADANSYEQWVSDGSKDAAARANKRWKKLLQDYQQPQLDPAIDEALEDYITRRKSEAPDLSYA
ncbi:trimethylamine methyltransferase family protein [Pelagibius sp. Alg239-R121]|uniref:trimethylamine methyltransferase family protein n=1 Tax=Pelagibius sp. Alg239-R121 TaxID=2993448 RepID=UPI0024A6E2CD|nr:trimethylamine methyltransferase family protein [Pelagibius sp. Alg239-R121]